MRRNILAVSALRDDLRRVKNIAGPVGCRSPSSKGVSRSGAERKIRRSGESVGFGINHRWGASRPTICGMLEIEKNNVVHSE